VSLENFSRPFFEKSHIGGFWRKKSRLIAASGLCYLGFLLFKPFTQSKPFFGPECRVRICSLGIYVNSGGRENSWLKQLAAQ
jgi:hypothetical protein